MNYMSQRFVSLLFIDFFCLILLWKFVFLHLLHTFFHFPLFLNLVGYFMYIMGTSYHYCVSCKWCKYRYIGNKGEHTGEPNRDTEFKFLKLLLETLNQFYFYF